MGVKVFMNSHPPQGQWGVTLKLAFLSENIVTSQLVIHTGLSIALDSHPPSDLPTKMVHLSAGILIEVIISWHFCLTIVCV